MRSKATVSYQGGKQRYTFPFPYLSRQFVKVRYEGGSGTTNLEYNREYSVEGQSVLLRSVAPENVTVYVYRQTPTSSLVDFNDGSLLLASAMDKMAAQLLHVEEENSDFLLNSAMVTDDDGAWQGRGRRIKNIRDPQQPQDVVTLNYLDGVGVARQDEIQRIEQAVRADKERALSFKNDAASSAQSAASSATNSAQSCAASEASRQASAESESKIKNMQVDVHAMQQHVDEVKTAIDGVAARAKADGQTASDAAVQAQNSAGASAQSASASEASAKRAEAAAKYDGIVHSDNLAEKSVHKKHLHQDVYESPALTGIPTAPTAGRGTNNGQIASTAFVAQAIAALVNSAPGALDSLQELAAALGNDANFATTVTNALAGKVSKSGDTMTGALKFDRINVACLIGSLLNGNAWRVFNGHGNAHTGFLAFDITNEDTEGIFLRKFNKDFSREIIAATLLDSENNTAFPGVVSAAGGFTGNLKGTASNSDNVGNKSLQWILDQINAAKTGIVASNLAQNGWVKFANGLIVQWGVGAEISGEQQFSITLPIAFQNACFSVSVTVIQNRGVSSDYSENFQVIEYNRDKIKLFLQHFENSALPAKPLYIAIGV